MFKIGDVVFYGAQGICKIHDIEVKNIGKISADYYVLKPIFNTSTALFVPVENKVLTAKMHNVLTKSQVNALIKKAAQIDTLEIKDENKKQEEYKSILSCGNREKLVSVIRAIRTERELRRQCGKKLNMNDEQILHKAENLIYNEIAFVLNIEPEQAQNTIEF